MRANKRFSLGISPPNILKMWGQNETVSLIKFWQHPEGLRPLLNKTYDTWPAMHLAIFSTTNSSLSVINSYMLSIVIYLLSSSYLQSLVAKILFFTGIWLVILSFFTVSNLAPLSIIFSLLSSGYLFSLIAVSLF